MNFLFCKPPGEMTNARPLFEKDLDEFGVFTLHSLILPTDLDIIHVWVNQEYAKRFWQLQGAKESLGSLYAGILANPAGHSFLGRIDGRPVCQVDIYQVIADELCNHVEARPDDVGMHLLMAPAGERSKGMTAAVLRAFLEYYFRFPQAARMFGEPDQENVFANKLILNLGFEFWRSVTLSYKTANLYCLTRERFLSHS